MMIHIKQLFIALLMGGTLITSTLLAQNQQDTSVDSVSTNQKLHLGFDQLNSKKYTGAIDLIYSQQIDDNSYTNSTHSLRGKLSSLNTLQSTGEPGADDLTYVIRGKSSTSSNVPLILVDGFESPIQYLTQEEIASVTILKDAVATAIYGVKGANGVILVTTKMGTTNYQNNGKVSNAPRITAKAEYGMMQLSNSIDMVDAPTYVGLVNEAYVNDGFTPRYSDTEVAGFKSGTQPTIYPNVDWANEMLKDFSSMKNISLQADGAFKKMRYYALVNYADAGGLFTHTEKSNRYSTNNSFQRINFRLNTSIKVFEHTKLDLRIGGRIQDDNDPEYGTGSYYSLLNNTPAAHYAMFNDNGSYYGNNFYRTNPLAVIESKGYTDRHFRAVNFNAALTRDLSAWVQGLSLKGQLSFINTFIAKEKYTGSFAVYAPGQIKQYADDGSFTWVSGYNEYGNNIPTKYSKRETYQDRDQSMRVSFIYDRQFGQHAWHAVLAGERNESVYYNNAEAYRDQGLHAHVNYTYSDTYMIDAVAAYNGTNSYSPSQRYGFFPALGFGWILSNENFMHSVPAIDYLKWRVSYGITGSDALNGYRRFMYYSDYDSGTTYRWGEKATVSDTGKKLKDVSNPDASFEKGYVFNTGFDVRFLKHFDATIDVFKENRIDILNNIGAVVTDMFGVTTPQINFGKVENYGMDFTLGYKNQIAKDWQFDARFNLGYAHNKIKKYIEANDAITHRVGQSVETGYGYLADGLYRTAEELENAPQNDLDLVQLGDVRLVDVNGDNHIDESDKIALCNTYPRTHFGLQTNLTYKQWTLALQLDGKAGYDILVNNNLIYNPLKSGSGNISQYVADNRWTAEKAMTASFPRLSYVGNTNNTASSTFWQKSGDYLKIRTVEIGYNFSRELINKVGLHHAKLYVRGHNLYTFDHLVKGYDPEVGAAYPLLRTYSLGLNLVF